MPNNIFSVVSKMFFKIFFSKINRQCQGYEENVKYWKAPLKLKGYVYEVTFEAEIRKSFFLKLSLYIQGFQVSVCYF